MLASAKALKAETILFQCPASFKQTHKNIASMEKFFCSIDRKDLNLCWEPWGDWDTAVLRSICTSLGFGPKTERRLLAAISLAKKPRNEINIHKALRLAEEVVSYLR